MMSDKSFVCKSFDYTSGGSRLLDAFQGRRHAFILHSSQHDPNRGRYTFLGADPFDVYRQKGERSLNGLKEKFYQYGQNSGGKFTSPLTPLACGAVGCLAYDYGLHKENIAVRSRDDLGLPDCFFGFYDVIITVDHFTNKLHITSSGLPESDPSRKFHRALKRLHDVERLLAPFLTAPEPPDGPAAVFCDGEMKSNMTQLQYVGSVEKALDHIAEGNIYQVNVSQRFEWALDQSTFDAQLFYKALSDYSPSPFGGYIDAGDFQLVSNSPERFLSLRDGIVQTRPMKGTRPRGAGPDEDRAYREEILESEKEKSELLMITDLQRNDLGRVCEYGSIAVTEHRTLEEYKYVFQATSNIQGVLKGDKDCFDLIEACFPGGSITGCPKIRAMEIIEELEPTRRGMYTGSMGYIGFDGNMDLNILIRTMIAKDGNIYFQVGSGIVADSDPYTEYRETLTKAGAMRACLNREKKVMVNHD